MHSCLSPCIPGFDHAVPRKQAATLACHLRSLLYTRHAGMDLSAAEAAAMHRLRKLAGVPAQVRASAAVLAGKAPQSRHPFQNRNRRPCRRSLTLNGWTSCSPRLSKLGSSPHRAKSLASRLASRLLPPLWSHRLCPSFCPPPPTGLP